MSQPPEVRIQINEHDNATPTSGFRNQKDEFGRDNVLVIATLITTLTYQVGTNLPRGYYQDDNNGHYAGDSILLHKDPIRYWLFIISIWAGFGSSVLMTMALLTGGSMESPLVRWLFALANSMLVLTFCVSLATTDLSYDLLFYGLFVLLFILWGAIKFCGALGALTKFVRRLFPR